MSGQYSMAELIERKKNGEALTRDEFAWICAEYAAGRLPDYQIAAWLMAVRWRGLTPDETFWLTEGMIGTGKVLEWPPDRPVVDKHSTGGVGDKTSIALVPLVASLGLVFVKMSGRGLGHTGGTLDKLESIPGFRVHLGLDELREQVERIGCAMVGQSAELVPADAAIYALRDVTSTVDSVPLIASSVMAKKLAAGAPNIVLDVKYGSGALLRTRAEAEEVAAAMLGIGKRAGRRVRALLSPMDEPLGRTVGNALEVTEAIETLHGGGPDDLRRLLIELGAHLLMLGGAATSLDDARAAVGRALAGGLGADHLRKLIKAQSGDPRVVDDPSRLPAAPYRFTIAADVKGWVRAIDARATADAVLALGAGRRRKEDAVDPRTGIVLLVKSGDRVDRGQPLAEVHAASEEMAASARELFLRGVEVVDEPTAPMGGVPEVLERW